MPETDLYYPIREYCNKYNLTAWGEVSNLAERNGGSVDTVVKFGNYLYAAIEIKRALNLVVLSQAIHNIKYFNASIVVVPSVRIVDNGRLLAYKIIKDYGIGLVELIQTNDEYFMPDSNMFTIKPKLKPRPFKNQKDIDKNLDCRFWLRQAQLYVEGGSVSGNQYSDRKNIMERIYYIVSSKGLVHVNEVHKEFSGYFKTVKDMWRAISTFQGKIKIGLKLVDGEGFLYIAKKS